MTEELTRKIVAWATETASYAAELPSSRARDAYLAKRRRELIAGARCDADCAAGKKLFARERTSDAFERAHFRVDPESGLGNGGSKHQQCGEDVSPGKRPGRAGFDEMAEQHGRQSTADCRADGVEDGDRERASPAETPRWRSDRRSSQPPTRRKRSASTQMSASRR